MSLSGLFDLEILSKFEKMKSWYQTINIVPKHLGELGWLLDS